MGGQTYGISNACFPHAWTGISRIQETRMDKIATLADVGSLKYLRLPRYVPRKKNTSPYKKQNTPPHPFWVNGKRSGQEILTISDAASVLPSSILGSNISGRQFPRWLESRTTFCKYHSQSIGEVKLLTGRRQQQCYPLPHTWEANLADGMLSGNEERISPSPTALLVGDFPLWYGWIPLWNSSSPLHLGRQNCQMRYWGTGKIVLFSSPLFVCIASEKLCLLNVMHYGIVPGVHA